MNREREFEPNSTTVKHLGDVDKSNSDEKSEPPISELLQQIKSAGRQEKRAIVEALLERREEALPTLRSTLSRGTPSEKAFAIKLLSEMRDSEAVPGLIELTPNEDLGVSLSAINALREMNAREALTHLKQILLSEKLDVRKKVCTLVAIGRLGTDAEVPSVMPFLQDPDESVETAAAAALVMLGSSEGKTVLVKMSKSDNQFAQRLAIESMGYLDDDEIKGLLENRLSDPNSHWKTEARIALERQKLRKMSFPTDRIRHLENLANDSNMGVAGWAVEQISDIRGPEARQCLEELAKRSGSVGQSARWQLKLKGDSTQ